MSPVRLRLPLAVAALVCAALSLPALAPARTGGEHAAARRAAQVECANVGLEPSADNLDAVQAAVLCLHNRDRAAAGLPALKENTKLRKAAVGHSDDMVSRRYFSHYEPEGNGTADRLKRAGYVRPGDGYSVGENIAWGTANLATPAEIHAAWMKSAEHRANILRRTYKEIGIGIVLGNPSVSPADAGATYTADFGVRR
jgi:uncharacterized protein YkwD